MQPLPDPDQIIRAARRLGITMGESEARQYAPHLIEILGEVDAFLQERIEENAPVSLHPRRERGRRPSSMEDPYRAWLWRCDIGGDADGLLAGKTVAFKDHISVAGVPQSFSSVALEDFIPDVDATVVTRVLAAGGRITGKSSMDGFMEDFDPPLNPHDPARVTGGSSSGGAVAVSCGEVDIAFGGDQGGSVRHPAAHCGIVGLKPTYGLISHFGAGFGSERTLDHIGPMAKRVEDVATALQAVAGHDPLDSRQERVVPESIDVLTDLDRGVADLRIGVLTEGFREPARAEVLQAVRAAVGRLESLGAVAREASVPELAGVRPAYYALMIEGQRAVFDTGFEGAGHSGHYPRSTIAAVSRMWRDSPDLLPARAKLYHIAADFLRQTYHGGAYAKAQNVRATYRRAFDAALDDVDLLVMPTLKYTAPLIEPRPVDAEGIIQASLVNNWILSQAPANMLAMNLTGHPSIAVPCGKVDGLPVSMQLVGRHFDDGLLLRAAYGFQEAVDWDEYTGVPTRLTV